MRQILFFLATGTALFLTACGSGENANGGSAGNASKVKGKIPFAISGDILNPQGDTLFLWDVWGRQVRRIARTSITNEGGKASFELSGKVPAKGIYYLGTDSEQSRLQIAIGQDTEFSLTADMSKIPDSESFKNSPQNTKLKEFFVKQQEFASRRRGIEESIYERMQQDDRKGAGAEEDRLIKMMQEQFEWQKEYAEANDDLVGKVAKIYQYEPYAGPTKNKYGSEGEYFIKNFLNHLDFDDLQYAYIPAYHAKLYSYAQNLAGNFYMEHDQFLAQVQPYVEQTPNETKLRALTLDAFMMGALSKGGNSRAPENPYRIDIYLTLAEQFLEQFPDDPKSANIREDLERYNDVRLGKQAPDIVMSGTNNEQFRLSDLRGKVVLVDFWASWCKPCRRENPNLVRTYKRFNPKGFEIFSVSLDSDRDKWLKAIEQDNLSWKYHVSDLSGWDNMAAKKYRVTGIPHSVLLDREGHIIAKGLRGGLLDQKLKEVL